VTGEHVEEVARLHRPHEDLKAVLCPGAHDLATRVEGKARELGVLVAAAFIIMKTMMVMMVMVTVLHVYVFVSHFARPE
jgi:hypothetical protein